MTGGLGAMVPGLTVFVAGAAFALTSASYSIGTVNQMGPGFLPFVLGIILAGLGVIEMFRSIGGVPPGTDDDHSINWYAIGCFVGSLLAFALLIERAGFVPAVFVATFGTMMAHRPVRPLAALLFGFCFAIASYLVFLKGLSMPISAFRW